MDVKFGCFGMLALVALEKLVPKAMVSMKEILKYFDAIVMLLTSVPGILPN